MKPVRVKYIYRNYKPLHAIYLSIIEHPPEGISFLIPAARTWLQPFLPIYHRFGSWPPISILIGGLQNLVFSASRDDEDCDLLHYLHMLPDRLPAKPFIVEIEHLTALTAYQPFTRARITHIKKILQHPRCRRIVALSRAVIDDLEYLFAEHFSLIAEKIFLLYPALPCYADLYSDSTGQQTMQPYQDALKILFVGNHIYRKGLHELLAAIKNLTAQGMNLRCFVISDSSRNFTRENSTDRIQFFPPVFDKNDIIQRFYLPADLFVMPTHWDTFGMALLDALSSATPVITTRQYCSAEIVTDKYDGFLVDSAKLFYREFRLPSVKERNRFHSQVMQIENELVRKLEERITFFYNQREEVRKMGINALSKFRDNGIFSLVTRNRKLQELYFSSLSI